MKIEALVCNVCQDLARPTERYEISRSGRHAPVDLCEEHALPYEHALDEVTVTRPAVKKTAGRPRRGGINVVPVDAIPKSR